MTPWPGDDELVAAVRRGDALAASALHGRLRPRVVRWVRRLMSPNDPDFEDILQLVMIAVVTSVDRYQQACSLDTWARTITAHVIAKYIRRRTVERRIFGAVDDGELSSRPSPSQPGRDVILRNLVARVRDHLGQIEESKALTFVLHDVCGYEVQEIAAMTGVTVAAAQTRLIRGRREFHALRGRDPELAMTVDALERAI